MEKRIYIYLAVVVSVTVLITTAIASFLFYDYLIINTNSDLSIVELFLSLLPAMVGALVIMLVILFLVASALTDRILLPIKKLSDNIEMLEESEELSTLQAYKEVQPFVRTIKKQHTQIENSLEELRQAEKIRSEFTANVSHELKTPLTSINGFAEMIESGMSSEAEAKHFAGIIRKEGKRLLELIDDILALSRIEDSKGDEQFEALDLYSIANDTMEKLLPFAREKNVLLELSGQPTFVRGNKRMLEDLLANLVDNSIKYNKKAGSVHVRINPHGEHAVLEVEDTGIGVSEEELPRIFERFYRVDKSRSKKVGGSGLGLAIVKHTVEYHSGSIKVESELGKGTKFIIKL